ncbi:hypothetical protein F5887DRAFT_952535 [Amanita rubescens]|nr:hypothetical protein F5887DRAFT_952535 [Amanita rubescens]
MPISTHFGCLDELTQVIYQSLYRFVVLSSVTMDEWIIHVGLADSRGRWWQGRWSQDNVNRILGSKASEKLLESFAEKLRESLTSGNLYIGNWEPDKGTNINLTFGPGSKDSVEILLHEVKPEEAADHATNVFIEIALQAQYAGVSFASIGIYSHMAAKNSKSHDLVPPAPVIRGTADVAAVERSSHSNVDAGRVLETKKTKGQVMSTSLANPNKKARKYAAIEFESDEE